MWSVFTQPSDEEIEALKRKRDSIAALQTEPTSVGQIVEAQADSFYADTTSTGTLITDSLKSNTDSVREEHISAGLGSFAEARKGNQEYFTIENEKIRITISTLGGRMVSVELKEYSTYDSTPLLLFDEDSSRFALGFFEQEFIQTDSLFFTPVGSSFTVEGDQVKDFRMRLHAGTLDKYIEYQYRLSGGSYLLDFKVNVVGLNDMLSQRNNENTFSLDWSIKSLSKEKGIENEQNTSTVFYKYINDNEVDYISERSSEKIDVHAKPHWVSFKQQFFSAVAIADQGFLKDSKLESRLLASSTKYTKYMAAELWLAFDDGANPSFPMSFYFGPNHYQTLKDFDMELEEQIDLGWSFIGWINEYLVIPVFNYLDSFDLNYGLIILILTLFIKLILFPLTYKSFKSTAKMKVLKPEIDELNEKNKNKSATEKQQATMALYRKAGANPLSGCIPMLFQMPILYAMFRFFPSSIELRGESFLWADDLSTYDSVLDLGFYIPMYGDHISLFCILMAISSFFYSKYNMQSSAGTPQMAQMKVIIYFFPIMLLVFFNNFSAGLSYYYFISNIITMGQQLAIKKWFISEKAIYQKIEEHRKKPAKRSNFQKRLEDMQRKRELQARGKQPKSKKKRR